MKYKFKFSATDKNRSNEQGLVAQGTKLNNYEKEKGPEHPACKGSIIMRHGRGTKMIITLQGCQKRKFKFGKAVDEVSLDKINAAEFEGLKCGILAMLQSTYNSPNFAWTETKAKTILKKMPSGFLRDINIDYEYKMVMTRLVRAKYKTPLNKCKVDEVNNIVGKEQQTLIEKYYKPRTDKLQEFEKTKNSAKAYNYDEYLKKQAEKQDFESGDFGVKKSTLNEEYSHEKEDEMAR